MATVSIEAVNQSYGQHPILKDVNLKIEKGEFVVIVGPSGCGKSTLLRLIAGLDTVQAGSILINNRCVNKTPPSSRDIAMVFQNYALYPHMSVFDNMAYGLRMRKMNKKNHSRACCPGWKTAAFNRIHAPFAGCAIRRTTTTGCNGTCNGSFACSVFI